MTTPTLRGILSPFEEIFPISWGALLGMIMDAGPYRGGGEHPWPALNIVKEKYGERLLEF